MRSSLLVVLVISACGAPGSTGLDAGLTPDAGATFDAGITSDAGITFDAGVTADAGQLTRVIDQFWAKTQWPPYLTLQVGETATLYGQVWVQQGTELRGAMPGLDAQVGVGAVGSAPSTWTWTNAVFNLDSGNNDEFKAEVTASTAGLFQYAFRFRVAGARWGSQGEWLHAGLAGPTLAEGEAGLLAVKGPGGAVKVATQNLECVRNDPSARFDALVTGWAMSGVEVIALQEVCDEAPLGNTAQLLAQRLTTRTGATWRHLFLQTHLANNTTPEGLGLLTKLPIAASDTTTLPTQEFPRKALLAVVATRAGMLAVCSTHFSFRPEDSAFRVQQAQAVLRFAGGWQGGAHPAGTALLVAGDFNATPGSGAPMVFTQTTPAFADAWATTHPGQPGLSFPSNAPNERIDYLMVRGLTVSAASHDFTQPFATGKYVSDHSGFSAELR